MINEIEYRQYWNDWHAGEAKAKELLKTIKECQKEFNWPEFKDDKTLCFFAKTRGLLSSDELQTIYKYLLY